MCLWCSLTKWCSRAVVGVVAGRCNLVMRLCVSATGVILACVRCGECMDVLVSGSAMVVPARPALQCQAGMEASLYLQSHPDTVTA